MTNPLTPDQEIELALAVAQAAESLFEKYAHAKQGKIDPQSVIDAASSLVKSLADNNTRADALVDEKFPKQ